MNYGPILLIRSYQHNYPSLNSPHPTIPRKTPPNTAHTNTTQNHAPHRSPRQHTRTAHTQHAEHPDRRHPQIKHTRARHSQCKLRLWGTPGPKKNETQKQPPELFYKKRVLKHFAKFTGKHLWPGLRGPQPHQPQSGPAPQDPAPRRLGGRE